MKYIVLFAFLFCGCSHVKVYDVEFCGDLAADGAHCAHTLTPAKRDIPKAQWDVERVGQICTKSTGFNDTETAIDQLCATTSLCDYETRQALAAAKTRLAGVIKRANAAREQYRTQAILETGVDPLPEK